MPAMPANTPARSWSPLNRLSVIRTLSASRSEVAAVERDHLARRVPEKPVTQADPLGANASLKMADCVLV